MLPAPLLLHEAFAFDISCRLSTAFLGTPWPMQHHMLMSDDPGFVLAKCEDVRSDSEPRCVAGTASEDANPIG
jgi:hypothetical protein